MKNIYPIISSRVKSRQLLKRKPPLHRKTKSLASAVITAVAVARWATKQAACFAELAPSPFSVRNKQ